ncbi:MAG: hypothetical protein JWP81_411 [Ferruginibacter sp.]|nr:hypothetical protein [Ferruginibacter sp.]
MTKAIARYSRTDGSVFQNTISTSNPKAWFSGEKILKKFPGFTTLKYSLAVAMDSGILLPQDLASTNEVYIFTRISPAAIVIEANKSIVFMFFFTKMIIQGSAELYLTDIFIEMPFYGTFIAFVFTRRNGGVSFKRFNEM